jgi:hypothetical protein
MRILLGMSFGEAESSDTLLSAKMLGLRNWMKGKKKEITTYRVLLGFGGISPLLGSKSSTVTI